jgi:hypothetical protein
MTFVPLKDGRFVLASECNERLFESGSKCLQKSQMRHYFMVLESTSMKRLFILRQKPLSALGLAIPDRLSDPEIPILVNHEVLGIPEICAEIVRDPGISDIRNLTNH